MAGRIETAEDARKLRAKLLDGARSWHEQLVRWRRLLDRDMGQELKALGASLPERLRERFDPYQAADADAEVEDLAALLASNEPDLELIVRGDASTAQGQKMEDALSAFYQRHWPVELRSDRYKGVLGDGIAIHAWDRLGPGAAVGAYGDRASLEADAESPLGDVGAETARGRYRAAYGRARGGRAERHAQAYREVTDAALAEDGPRWRHRLVDPEQFACFLRQVGSLPEVVVGMEDQVLDLNPVIEALADYGVRYVGGELVCGDQNVAVGGESAAAETEARGRCTVAAGEQVRYTQIRTADEVVVLVEGVRAGRQGGTIFVRSPQPFVGETGYFLVPGRTKLRGTMAQRFAPLILPLLVEQQIFNEVETARLAMAWAEASREEYELDVSQAGPPPFDAAQRPAAAAIETGAARRPMPLGEVKRVETTGLDMATMARDHLERLNSFRSREFFSGSGVASESGRHLAQTQTAQLTKLVPVQSKCAAADKRQLMAVVAVHARSGEPLYVDGLPGRSKLERDGVQRAGALVVTPEMARMPYDLRVTIGADTPQAQWAKQQVSREEVSFGTYGLTEHREIVGVRDPQQTVRRMTIDALQRAFLGTDQVPGLAVEMAIAIGKQRMAEIFDALMPPPPSTLAPAAPLQAPQGMPEAAGMMPEAAGTAGTPASGAGAGGVFVPPAVPGLPGSVNGGVPDVAGGMGR